MKPTREELKIALCKKTCTEAAILFGTSKRTLCRWLKQYDLKYEECKHSNLPPKLNAIQSDLYLASMLGDGNTSKRGIFKLKMTRSSEEYVRWAMEIMAPFSSNLKYESSAKFLKVNGKFVSDKTKPDFYKCVSFYTPSLFQFRELHAAWYLHGKKIVPTNLILNERIVYHWFLHDGHNNQAKKTISFATHCFSVNEVVNLCDKLNQLGISAKMNLNSVGQPIINVNSRGYFHFMEMIQKQLQFECFKYKTDTSKVPKVRWEGAGKLNRQQANEIRLLYGQGLTQMAIAKKYRVSQILISRIVNNIIHKVNHHAN